MTSATMPTAPAAPFKLEIHVCDARLSYLAEFPTEQAALGLIDRQKAQDAANGYAHGNHAYSEIEGFPVPEGWDRLSAFLYPTCEHGLSADLCAGYGHYPMDHPAYM